MAMFPSRSDPAPINSLPPELLSEIFWIVTRAPPAVRFRHPEQDHLPVSTETIRRPLILSTVCRHWRAVTLNTPSLWSTILTAMDSIIDPDDATDADDESDGGESWLDTSHITSYLRLSRGYPLDIIVDARDPSWDFSEPEIPSAFEFSDYIPPFDSSHMETVMSHIIPHVYRWRSITIMTDTWAPMHTALGMLNGPLGIIGAPILESLVLMRCNEYVSNADRFQPPLLRLPPFLDFREKPSLAHIFPRLKNLTLRGVHVDWSALNACLTDSEPPLESLEISCHSAEVRPYPADFFGILSASPSIRKIVVRLSGPMLPTHDFAEELDWSIQSSAIYFPELEELNIGYRSHIEGGVLLQLFDAPKLKHLTLDDSTHPGDLYTVQADDMLAFVASGRRQTFFKDLSFTYNPTSTILPASAKVTVRQDTRRGDSSERPATTGTPFPSLEEIHFKRVTANPQSFGNVFEALPRLRKVDLHGVPVELVEEGLSPRTTAVSSGMSSSTKQCPCPELQYFSIHSCTMSEIQRIQAMLNRRTANGARKLEGINIYVEFGEYSLDEVLRLSHECGTSINVFERPPPAAEVEENELARELMEADAYLLGGAFNDPLFDAVYAAIEAGHW